MRRLVSLVPIAVLAACKLAGADVKGSGTAGKDHRTPGAFTAIEVSGAIELHVAIGGAAAIDISGDDNVVPLVTTVVKGKTLEIGTKDSYRNKLPLVVRVTAPAVTAVSASGASTAEVRGIAGDDFAASLSGAGKLDLAGTIGRLTVDASGAGQIAARDLAAKDVTVEVSGAGEVAITASSSLTASVSGAASIDYWGHPPSVTKDVSGVGSINAH